MTVVLVAVALVLLTELAYWRHLRRRRVQDIVDEAEVAEYQDYFRRMRTDPGP